MTEDVVEGLLTGKSRFAMLPTECLQYFGEQLGLDHPGIPTHLVADLEVVSLLDLWRRGPSERSNRVCLWLSCA